jgi:hypothetical protein
MSAGTDETDDRRGLAVPPEVLVQELPDDELMFLDMRTDGYFALDSTGARMFRALVDAPDHASALGRLLDEFDVPPERLDEDLRAFTARLTERGLLVRRPR